MVASVLRRLLLTLVCICVGGVASAGSARVRWRGVAVEGRPPAALQTAVQAHVGVALKSLGSSLVTAEPQDAEAAASCAFPSSAKVARCLVVVQANKAARAERRAEIRYRDAEDLAESLALLVSDILTSEFPDIVGGAHQDTPPALGPSPANPPPTNPPPTNPPPQNPPPANPTPPTPEQEKAHEAEMARQLEVVKQLQKQADDARAASAKDAQAHAAAAAKIEKPAAPSPTRTAVEIGGSAIGGVGRSNPWLAGALARLSWSRGLLRVGGALSLTGMSQTLSSGIELSYFRTAIAARVGIGTHTRLVDVDLTAGPALVVLYENAHGAGHHTLASFAAVVGPRLALTLAGPVALVLGADLDIAATDEKVTVNGSTAAELSRVSFEMTLGIAWRSGY